MARITVDGAAYILIEGFHIEGNVRNVSMEYAFQEKSNLNNPITAANGISLTNSYMDPQQFPHHVIIRNNHIHHCPGGGIVAVGNLSFFNAQTPTMTADVEVNNSSHIWLRGNWIIPRRDRNAVEAFDNTDSSIQRY